MQGQVRSHAVSRWSGPALLLSAVLMTGCVNVVPVDGPVFILEYTLRQQGDDAEVVANPGEHCGTARVRGDHVEVASHTWDEIGRPGQFVVVDPELEGSWATLGHEPFPLALPTEVRPGVEGDDEVIATLEWRSDNAGNEGLWVDGRAVTLPYAFTHNSRSGQWDAVALITQGPDTVQTFEAGPCA